MKYIRISLLFFCCIYLLQPLVAQTAQSEHQEVQVLMEQAKKQMAAEDYEAANRSFRKMLETNAVLPTDMCFYFATTLYMIGQYENSLRFVEKYERLAGSGGEYFRETAELKLLLGEEMETIKACNHCDLKGYVLETCHECEGKGELFQSCRKCFGRVKIKCETCSGEGVKIEKDHFGQKHYQSCPTCEGEGIQICPLCKGKGSLSSKCRSCGGSGQRQTVKLCSHPPHPSEAQ